MKIALASQPTLDDSIALNVNRIEKALASLRKKVDLVAFGESYLQGFNSLKWNFERDRTVAVSVDSQPIKMLRYTAKKYSVAVSFGYYELCDEAIYSSYMFIGKNGEIVNNFRRVSKGWKEYDITDEHYKEGDGFRTGNRPREAAAARRLGTRGGRPGHRCAITAANTPASRSTTRSSTAGPRATTSARRSSPCAASSSPSPKPCRPNTSSFSVRRFSISTAGSRCNSENGRF